MGFGQLDDGESGMRRHSGERRCGAGFGGQRVVTGPENATTVSAESVVQARTGAQAVRSGLSRPASLNQLPNPGESQELCLLKPYPQSQYSFAEEAMAEPGNVKRSLTRTKVRTFPTVPHTHLLAAGGRPVGGLRHSADFQTQQALDASSQPVKDFADEENGFTHVPVSEPKSPDTA